MRNAFLLITNTIGHAEEEWNTKVPPRGHQISKTRLSGLERPKDILSDIGSLKSRLANLEKAHGSINKELKNVQEALKRQDSTIAQLGKKPAKKEKRKPSEYNLFLKDKMSAGMSMVDAVKAWKEKEGGSSSTSSSMKQPGQDWQSPSQQY